MFMMNVERACSSPLIFVATGSMGPTCTATTVFRKLASMLADK